MSDDSRSDEIVRSLHLSEETHRVVVSALAEGVVLQNADGSIATCNEAAEQILGLTAAEMAGRTSADPRWRAIRADGSELAGHDHPAMRTLRTGEPLRDQLMGIHRPGGDLRWISVNTRPIFQPGQGRPAAVVASFYDVTEARRSAAELERSEERLRLALESARMGTWEWVVGSDRVAWTDRTEELFGLPPGSFDGSYESYVALVHPEDRPRLLETIRSALEDPVVGERYQVEHRVVTPCRKIRWLQCLGRVIRDASGKPTRMLGTVMDVTDRKELESRLVQSQKLESVGRLAGGLAHDFNNLLTAIVGSADLLAQRAESPSTEIGTILDACDRARRLTRQLLTFASRQHLRLSVVDVNRLLDETAQLLLRLIGEDVELVVRRAEQPLCVVADRGLLEQLFVNLAVNAREAMPRRGTLTFAVDAADVAETNPRVPAGEYVLITAEDTGIGMDDAVRSHVFEPFFTTKPNGSGLGLATCYGIVKQLGGEIDVESRVGEGTTFRIWIPRTKAPGDEPHPEPQHTAALRYGSETVLLVEDDPLVRSATGTLLESLGYRVLPARDGEEALAVIRTLEEPVDLVVTDVVMPRLSGWELAEQLCTVLPDVRVLFVSGYSEEVLSRHGVMRENLDVLPKPFDARALALKVREMLDR